MTRGGIAVNETRDRRSCSIDLTVVESENEFYHLPLHFSFFIRVFYRTFPFSRYDNFLDPFSCPTNFSFSVCFSLSIFISIYLFPRVAFADAVLDKNIQAPE